MPTSPVVHRVPTSQRTLAQLARINAPKVPWHLHVVGPYSLLQPLPPTAPFQSRGGHKPQAPRCQLA